MSKSVTITLTKDNYYNPARPFGEVGMFMRIAREKRLRLKVTDIDYIDYAHKLTVIKGYKPAPRSRLKQRTVFSKIKGRIF